MQSGGIIIQLFTEEFTKNQINELSTLTLAHVGDAVFEILARTHVARKHGGRVQQMHRFTVALVSAAAQASAARGLISMLTTEETEVFMRGRNAKPKSLPKNAKPEDYALATGLEAVFGMLYLSGQNTRALELWEEIVSKNSLK